MIEQIEKRFAAHGESPAGVDGVNEQLVLVDEVDQMIGLGSKLDVHSAGLLHRAFSIFVINSAGQVLLQKRAGAKYHSGRLWSNTCCGHPRPHEALADAAHRRLREEMGFDCPLNEIFSITYNVQVSDDLFENEYNHVLIGRFDGEPSPNAKEVEEWKWLDLRQLQGAITSDPEIYTPWLLPITTRLSSDCSVAHHP